MCKQIDHFPEDTNYEADPSEYFLREYRCCFVFLLNTLFNEYSFLLVEQIYFSLK